MNALSIKFFENLSQNYYDQKYFDLHNHYDCKKVEYSANTLSIIFNSVNGDQSISLTFAGVVLTLIDFFNVKEAEVLTIDSLYRGRAEYKGRLIDVLDEEKAYFYLEFYEGQKLEFWASSIDVKLI